MSFVEVREAVLDSPWRAFSLFTVRAAISSARLSERPCCFWLSLMCSYWRARFVPFLTPRGGIQGGYPGRCTQKLPATRPEYHAPADGPPAGADHSRDRPLADSGQPDPPARGLPQPPVGLREPARPRVLLDPGRGDDGARRAPRGAAASVRDGGPQAYSAHCAEYGAGIVPSP